MFFIFYGQYIYFIIDIHFIQRWENVKESSKQHTGNFYGGGEFWRSRQILRDKLSLKRENVATSRSGSNPG